MLLWPDKRRFLGQLFFPVSPIISILAEYRVKYYRPDGYKSNFSLAKNRIFL
jgi:hypothetical protein